MSKKKKTVVYVLLFSKARIWKGGQWDMQNRLADIA